MRTLDENFVYDLSELTSEELKELAKYMQINHGWKYQVPHTDLFWHDASETWLYNKLEKVNDMVNAKELFYTLENVQVDCRELTKDQVKEMCDIYENKGYYLAIHAKENEEEACILSYNNITQDGEYGFYKYDEQENNEYTITYEKFMELFAPKYEDTMIAEQPKGELCDNLKPLINAVEILNELKAYKEKSEKILTLDSIQVDCRNLTEEQIKEMADVFEKNGFDVDLDGITDEHFYLRLAKCEASVDLFRIDDTKTTITYGKFMELFREQEVSKPTLSQYFKDLTPIDNPPFIKADSLGYIGQIVDNEEESSAVTPEEIVKYLSKKDIFLTPKQYKKLWKKLKD